MTIRTFLAASICSAVFASAANAVTYRYAGTDYQTVIDPYTTSMRIKAEIVVRKAIPPNYQGSVEVKSYKVYDGVYKLNKFGLGRGVEFNVTTDENGSITAWRLVTAGHNPGGGFIGQTTENDQDYVGDAACWSSTTGCDEMAGNVNAPGVWSISTP
jgi:hypothetical protein